MDLTNLIETHLDLPGLATHLDELGPEGRLWAVRRFSGAHLATLWEAAQNFQAIGLDHFVPASMSPHGEVLHEGKNSLAGVATFQKLFCRPREPSDAPLLVGYNRHPWNAFTSPGYFVARARSSTDGVSLPEVDFDYTVVPQEKAPHWPAIEANSVRLGRFVYEGIVDVMRGVSSHVSIGRARKGHHYIDAWFALVRQDPSAGADDVGRRSP